VDVFTYPEYLRIFAPAKNIFNGGEKIFLRRRKIFFCAENKNTLTYPDFG
jgi:hypothetical protein